MQVERWVLGAVALLLAVSSGACAKFDDDTWKKTEAAKPDVEVAEVVKKPPAPTFLEEKEAEEPSFAPDSSAGMLPRFEAKYKTTAEVTEDAELAGLIEDLAATNKGAVVLEKLKPRKKEVLPVLHRAVWHKDPNVRGHVAKILILLEDKSADTRGALVDVMLHDPDQEVRSNFTRALVTFGSRETVPSLIEAMQTDPYKHVRANAAWALREIGDSRAKTALIGALDDQESWVRLRAVGALKELKAKDALPKLRTLTRDENEEVRKAAIKAVDALSRR